MNWHEFTLSQAAIVLTALMLTAAVILAFVRLLRGPSLPDRVVALDLISAVVSASPPYAIATDQPVLLDVAIALALITFLGTVAFANTSRGGPAIDWVRRWS